MPSKRDATPPYVNPILLGKHLIEEHTKGNSIPIQTSYGTLHYVLVQSIGSSLGMIGYASDSHRGHALVQMRGHTPVVTGVYAVSDLVPKEGIPALLVHEHVEAQTGNHYTAIKEEMREAARLSIEKAQQRLSRERGLGLSLNTLYAALVGNIHFRKVVKIRSIIKNPRSFKKFRSMRSSRCKKRP